MSNESEVGARFADDTKDHVMKVELDQGVHRCIYFGKPGTGSYSFRIVTWPGHLGYSGDMGDFMFSRLTDMFRFFRGHKVNPSYWAEKCVAQDRSDGVKKFSPTEFIRAVESEIKAQWDSGEDAPPDLVEALMVEAKAVADDGEYAATAWAMGWEYAWEHDGKKGTFQMSDFYEHNCKTYTHRFLWCLHALVWGIAKYDESKTQVSANNGDA